MTDQNQNSAVMEVAATMSISTKTTYAGAASGFLASLASLDELGWLGIKWLLREPTLQKTRK